MHIIFAFEHQKLSVFQIYQMYINILGANAVISRRLSEKKNSGMNKKTTKQKKIITSLYVGVPSLHPLLLLYCSSVSILNRK